MENIIAYYKICGVKSPDDQINPIFNQLEKDILNNLLGANSEIYLTTKDGIKTFNETIIGGRQQKKTKKINSSSFGEELSSKTQEPMSKTQEPTAYPTSIRLYKPLKFKMVKLLFLLPKNE